MPRCSEQGEGSLTSSAKKVFLADIHMKVVDTKLAVLDVNFLLRSAAHVIAISLALVRGVVSHGGVLGQFRRYRASVDAVGGGRQRGRGRRDGAGHAHHQVTRVRRELGRALRGLGVTGHDGSRMRECGDVGPGGWVWENLGAEVAFGFVATRRTKNARLETVARRLCGKEVGGRIGEPIVFAALE